MNRVSSRAARLLLASVITAGMVVVVAVGTSAGAPGATSPAKQIAGLKRQVASLKRENKRLRAQNARMTAFSPAGIARQLQRTKAALDKYQSVDEAKKDGYAAASPCEMLPKGVGGESSHSGTMGIHFVSGAAMGDGKLDPAKPEILLYVPVGDKLELVAAEYFKPDADQNTATDDDRPTLFGRSFDGPMLGHAPGMPIHYDLHVWLWKTNPSGRFAPWNPALSC